MNNYSYMSKWKKIIGVLALILTIPFAVQAARTDALWDYVSGVYTPNGSAGGVDILIKGSNKYLNWGSVSGTSGYGIRDNAGTMEVKNSGGSWATFGSGGGGSSASSTLLGDFNTWTGGNTFAQSTSTILAAGSLRLTSITGSTQCLHVDTNGVVSGTGSDCGSGSGGSTFATTSISAIPPLVWNPTTAAMSILFSTTTANTWNLAQTFSSAPIFSTLTGLLKGNGVSALTAAAASDIISLFSGCSGTQYLGADGACHTDQSAAGAGVGTVSTSTTPTSGQLAVWGNPTGWPATLYSIATTTLTATYPAALSQPVTIIGTTPSVFSLAFSTTTANTWSALQTFTSGIFSGSTTIGGGTQAGGLTVSGGATTTGNTYLGGAFKVIGQSTLGTLSGLLYGNTGVVNATGTSTPTVTAPITYSGTLGYFVGGSSGAFDCTSASGSVKGCLTAANWTTFNDKQAALVSGTNIKTVNGTTLLGSGDLGTITVGYGGTGAATFGQGWIYSAGGTGALAASTSPTVNYLVATSTTATSTFPRASFATSISILGEYMTNFTTYVRSLFSAGNTSLTYSSGAFNINLANRNDWTAHQTFASLFATAASTTNATSTNFFTSGQYVATYGAYTGVVSPMRYISLSVSTSTAWTATTTGNHIKRVVVPFAGTIRNAVCTTDTGTVNVDIYHATTHLALFNASTTVGTMTFSANNTVTAKEVLYMSAGTPTSTPTVVACTIGLTE